jgi:hypothetical protein
MAEIKLDASPASEQGPGVRSGTPPRAGGWRLTLAALTEPACPTPIPSGSLSVSSISGHSPLPANLRASRQDEEMEAST